MSLAGLYNVPFTREELNTWAFSHMANHRDINQALYLKLGVAVPEYQLDPIDINNPGGMSNWAYQHQAMHTIQDQILGIAGFDLTDIKWQDKGEFAVFVYLNASEHVQACKLLGIG